MQRVAAQNTDGRLVTAGDATAVSDSATLARDHIDSVGVVLVRWAGLPAYWATTRRYLELAGWILLTGLAIMLETIGFRQRHRPRPPGRAVPAVATALVAALVALISGGSPPSRRVCCTIR